MDVAKVSACHRPRSSRRILLLTVMLGRTEGRRGSDEQSRGREKVQRKSPQLLAKTRILTP